MKCYLILTLLAISATGNAIVIRADVADANYRIPASTFPALVDMPGEGHGVLIAQQWAVTAAHAVPSKCVKEVIIGGAPRRVEGVLTHPGYKKLPHALIMEARESGDSSKAEEFLASSDDIALLKLSSPVTDISPMVLYRGNAEIGKTIQLIGKGATGNGTDGEIPGGSHRTTLRRAFNVVVDADARWISYVFDPPPSALPLEGMTGSGDSGGPVIIEANGQMQLAGLDSWSKYAQSDVRPLHAGLYGQVGYSVRISRYIRWIESIMAAEASHAPCSARGE